MRTIENQILDHAALLGVFTADDLQNSLEGSLPLDNRLWGCCFRSLGAFQCWCFRYSPESCRRKGDSSDTTVQSFVLSAHRSCCLCRMSRDRCSLYLTSDKCCLAIEKLDEKHKKIKTVENVPENPEHRNRTLTHTDIRDVVRLIRVDEYFHSSSDNGSVAVCAYVFRGGILPSAEGIFKSGLINLGVTSFTGTTAISVNGADRSQHFLRASFSSCVICPFWNNDQKRGRYGKQHQDQIPCKIIRDLCKYAGFAYAHYRD